MQIETFYDADTFTLTYVVYDAATRDAVLIDPVLAYDPIGSKTSTSTLRPVIDFVKGKELRVHYVLETHAHADHLSGSQYFKHHFPDTKVAIGARITDVQTVFKGVFQLGADFATDGSQFDRLLRDGEVVEAGALRFETIFTPGHTPACATYRFDDAVFTGDALFMPDQGTGRCDFPAGSADDLYASIMKLYALPDDTRVFVGHDYQPDGRPVRWETTIGASKKSNVQLPADLDRAAFVAARQARDATLAAPRLLYPSVQVNVRAGHLPAPHPESGLRYLTVPVKAPEGD
ncbi:MAG: MBL fold metallo-hydrolase [Myxococcales bacterium]|nr:MBL fold metallo-hydrolase [Myxococcales bacterium]MCB9539318.1 MBL fold metallo-hydrolase [Myxococcales bacterium]